MNDCPNAEIRDLLCDAIHGTLADAGRRRVDEHVATCADCRAELALLHRARTVLTRRTPQIDAARIALAIPPRRATARALRFSTWRVAATIAVMAVGAASLSLARREFGTPNGAGNGESAASSAAGAQDAHLLSFSGRLSTLNDADLEQLLADIDDFDGGTPAEPAAVLPVPAWDGGIP
jgi:anti-sigma factor RsiW